MKIAIIGVGNLGYSIALGILSEKKAIKCKSLYLTKRHLNSLNHLEKVSAVKLTTDNQRAVKYSDVIILAVQPAQLHEVLEEIKPDNPRFGMDALGQAADWYMGNGKPADAEQAAEMLRSLSGRRHRVISTVALVSGACRRVLGQLVGLF